MSSVAIQWHTEAVLRVLLGTVCHNHDQQDRIVCERVQSHRNEAADLVDSGTV